MFSALNSESNLFPISRGWERDYSKSRGHRWSLEMHLLSKFTASRDTRELYSWGSAYVTRKGEGGGGVSGREWFLVHRAA